jgi:serine/threonine protein kinase
VDRSTGETVAVKFLRKECWNDPRATAALIREFEVLRELNHPRILSIRGWGSTRRGALFLVTDFIHGMNLSQWRRLNHPDVKKIILAVAQVAVAVSAAHSKGILHGDLKPANVMLREDGTIVLCDFGLARHATDPDDVPRGGTAGFLAPEQISDAFGPVTERSDVYGLGGLFYALLTGHPPMVGRDLPETLSRILSRATADPPSAHSSICFAELDCLVLRCLAKEPSERFCSAEEVSNALPNLVSSRLVFES